MRHSHEELQLLEPKNMKKRTKQRPERHRIGPGA